MCLSAHLVCEIAQCPSEMGGEKMSRMARFFSIAEVVWISVYSESGDRKRLPAQTNEEVDRDYRSRSHRVLG